MEGLDLFKDWTPEMIEALKHLDVHERSKPLSEEHKKKISRSLIGHPGHPRSTETKEKISKANTDKPSGFLGRTHSEETKKIIAKYQRDRWEDTSDEEKKDLLESSIHSKEAKKAAIEGTRRFYANLMPKEIRERMRNSCLSGEAMERSAEGIRRYHASMTPEEKEEFLKRGVHSEVARRKVAEKNRERMKYYWKEHPEENSLRMLHVMQSGRKRPTMPEKEFGRYLEARLPGLMVYNGDGSQKVAVGGRIPDYIRRDGIKQAISIMGGIGWYHFLDDEGVETAHYKKHGWECVVIWEWDCYLWKELDKILGEKKGDARVIWVP